MKNRYLILSSGFNKFGANSICVRNIVNEISRRGDYVTVLSEIEPGFKEYDIENGVEVYRIKPTIYNALSKNHSSVFRRIAFKICSVARLLVAIPFYPNVTPAQTCKWYHEACSLIEERGINCVVCFYRSYSPIKTGLLLKKKYGERIQVVTFHLDLLSSISNKHPLAIMLKRRGIQKALKQEFAIADKVIVPENAKKMNFATDKCCFCGFPIFMDEPVRFEPFIGFSDQYINITYVGTLDKNNRNPKFIISLIDKMPLIRSKPVILHIWGIISDDETKKILGSSSSVKYYGVVDNSKVWGILKASDFLLNISNLVTYDMLPSKTFQLISANKPIINVVQHKDDCAVLYYEKAMSVLNLRVYSNTDHSNELEHFLNSDYKRSICNKKDLFRTFTPQYAVDLLETD